MDKIREEFENRARNMGYDLSMSHGEYIEPHTMELKLGYLMAVEDYRFLDKEIRLLKNDIDDYTEQVKDSLTSAKMYQEIHVTDQVEIKKLEEKCRLDIVVIEEWMGRDKEHKDKNKKLRDALEEVKQKCILHTPTLNTIYNMVTEALKESEQMGTFVKDGNSCIGCSCLDDFPYECTGCNNLKPKEEFNEAYFEQYGKSPDNKENSNDNT